MNNPIFFLFLSGCMYKFKTLGNLLFLAKKKVEERRKRNEKTYIAKLSPSLSLAG